MMSCKKSVGAVIKTGVTGVIRIALTGQLRIIQAARDHVLGLPRWICHAIGPTQRTDGLRTLDVIDQSRDVDLHRWSPVSAQAMGWHQCRPCSLATTLESNKSEI